MTLPFDVDYTSCHAPYFQRYDVSSNRKYMTMMITLFSLIIFHSHRCFQTYIYSLLELYRNFTATTMETVEYWLMACKYAIWNAAIASLQFWTEDLDPITLAIALECIYTTFFWTPTSHTLHQLSEDVLLVFA